MIPICLHASGKRRRAVRTLARGIAVACAEKRDLSAAFFSLSKQRSLVTLTPHLRTIAMELQGGRPSAEVFTGACREKVFGAFFCRTAARGLLSENPPLFFSRLADHLAEEELFRKKIWSLLKGPLLFMSGAAGALAAALVSIIPHAARTVSTLSIPLPMPTRTVLDAFTALQHFMPLIASVAVILLAGAWYVNSSFGWTERCACTVPFLGGLCRKFSLRRTASRISFLLSNGAGIAEALETAAAAEPRAPLRARLFSAARQSHRNGASSVSALDDAEGIFPPSVFNTSSSAPFPESENILFGKVAHYYEEEIKTELAAALLIIEPAFVMIAGLIGGGILAALYLPLLRGSSGH
jgi:type IV pilus assembly protein PilC